MRKRTVLCVMRPKLSVYISKVIFICLFKTEKCRFLLKKKISNTDGFHLLLNFEN
jgi:hypothetical protein